ncbi:MAG: flavodoxin-dependent (E)-4-hydroxy-3-methylbut-2-enyl-diphosphate synthase [Clostridia bacterium]
MRVKKKEISIGNVKIGAENPIVLQSMTTTNTADAVKTLEQINELYLAGCQIARVAVPDEKSAYTLEEICAKSPIPVVADIHFDHKLALISADMGISKIRINPGNIGPEKNVELVAKKCLEKNIPIRIGVNSGSVEKNILKKYGAPTPEALVESAFYHINLLEKYDFKDICVSIKSSNVQNMMKSYMLMSEKSDYPLHLGVTEAGTEYMGTIKSSIGIGGLLALGIGDTIRVSLTDDPVKEIIAGKAILKSLGLNDTGVDVVSCPTCGRCNVNLIEIAKEVEQKVSKIKEKLTVAVMGCVVNGPGEAREADYGLAGGNGEGIIFKKGKIIKKVPQNEVVEQLLDMIYEDIGEVNA